jgi:type I site-specific restriction endonuclease
MAKRSTRKNIRTYLTQAQKYADAADAKLAQIQDIYYTHGYKEGAELNMIRESLKLTRTAIERFRAERS